jgi:dTDP-4-dehydrorhamnose reductase
VVNCAAYTAVDKAEEESARAFQLNAAGVRNVAEVANENGSKLIHISTDYVFDGGKEGAYVEEDPTGPLGVYGRSKLEGERFVAGLVRPHFIIRTAWLYGKYGPNFVSTMLRLFKERRVVRVVNDQRGSPTYAADLAGALLEVVVSDSSLFGVYHYTNAGETTWYGFAKAILGGARALGLLDTDVDVQPIRTDEYPTKTRRPKNSVLSKEKIARAFGLKIRNWDEALEEYLRSLAGQGG